MLLYDEVWWGRARGVRRPGMFNKEWPILTSGETRKEKRFKLKEYSCISI